MLLLGSENKRVHIVNAVWVDDLIEPHLIIFFLGPFTLLSHFVILYEQTLISSQPF